MLLGTSQFQPPRVGGQKRVQKMIDGRARDAKMAEEMMENSPLKLNRKYSNNDKLEKSNLAMKEIKSTMIEGIKSGAIKAKKSFNPHGTYVPKAQKLERVMKKLQINTAY